MILLMSTIIDKKVLVIFEQKQNTYYDGHDNENLLFPGQNIFRAIQNV